MKLEEQRTTGGFCETIPNWYEIAEFFSFIPTHFFRKDTIKDNFIALF